MLTHFFLMWACPEEKSTLERLSASCQTERNRDVFFTPQNWNGFSNVKEIEWLHIHNVLLQSALLNQTAWKRGTLSVQMTPIYHVSFCFCSSRILVYSSVDTAAQCLLTLHNPEGCPVLCLKHSSRYLFAGLRNGSMMFYGRRNSGELPPRISCFCFTFLSVWCFLWPLSILSTVSITMMEMDFVVMNKNILSYWEIINADQSIGFWHCKPLIQLSGSFNPFS